MQTMAFNGDYLLLQELLRLKQKHQADTIIETGTHVGYSTKVFAEHFEKVFTIETKQEHLDRAINHCKGQDNISFSKGSSIDVLPAILHTISSQPYHKTPIIYLDGHWENEPTPLLRELMIIAASGFRPVLLIHDFVVPGHPELGFDTYDGQPYEWKWIENYIHSIYNGRYQHYYNQEAPPESAKRGCLFVEPEM